MDVIRHDNKRLELDLGKMKRDLKPGLLNYTSQGGQMDGAVYDFAEEAAFPVRANGDEIQPALGVIEALEADGPAVKM